MSATKELGHLGTRSWWDGTFRTLCGQTFRTSRSATWKTEKCAACTAAKKAGRR
ncbi:hypothetical protein [Actinophytocola sediminis]